MRKKISISIDDAILRNAEGLIGQKNIRNKSQAIEYALRKFFSSVSTAVILLGKEISVQKDNLYRIIQKVVSAGVTEIIIAPGPNLNSVFGLLENKEFGAKIRYIEEKNLFGTAGAVKSAQKYISSPFLVLGGNIQFEIDLKKMIDFHTQKDSLATMCITVVELKDSTDNIILNGDKIELFSYRTSAKSRFNNAGIYIFQPKILELLPERGSLEKDFFPNIAQQGDLLAFISSSHWKSTR